MKLNIAILAATIALTGCASGINSVQKQEMKVYELKGMAVEEKDPAIAAGLGILPGGGSFYTGEYGYGVLNLLFWPASILWDPLSGVNGAESLNYTATKLNVEKLKGQEIEKLDEKFTLNQIDMKKYMIEKNKIEKKYSSQ